jgi:hypothetical protein
MIAAGMEEPLPPARRDFVAFALQKSNVTLRKPS